MLNGTKRLIIALFNVNRMKKNGDTLSGSRVRLDLFKTLSTRLTNTHIRNARIAPHHMKDHITMLQDVRRSVGYWDLHIHLKLKARLRKRKALLVCLEKIADSFPGVRYYQGVHDVCLFLLELCNEDVDMSARMAGTLLLTYFHDFMSMDSYMVYTLNT